MDLEKVGVNIGKEIIAWTKTGNSLLTARLVKMNLRGIKYAPELKKDTFVRRVETWRDPIGHVVPYAQEGETMVKGHHNFHSGNDMWNQTFNHYMRDVEVYKDTDPQFYQECINDYMRLTKRLYKKNTQFTFLQPQPRNCTAYRGVNRRIGTDRQDFDVINNSNIGDIIVPTRGFAYAAHHKFGAFQYLGSPYDYMGNVKFEPMLIEYIIPESAQVSSNLEHGGEIVFPALSKYKLLSKETRYIQKLDFETGKPIGSYPYKHVILEYIPDIPVFDKNIEEIMTAISIANEEKNWSEVAYLIKKLNS